MRIIAGQFRGRRLTAPKGNATRPTTDRDREALFSALSHQLDHDFSRKHVLDLFAGSGMLGFEALSRGAAHATFAENNRGALACIEENIETLGVQQQTTLLKSNALRLPKTLGPYDLAFADAPYGNSHSLLALNAAFKEGLIKKTTLCILECSEDEGHDLAAPELDILWHNHRANSVFAIFTFLDTL